MESLPLSCHHARPPEAFHSSEAAPPAGLPAPPRHRLTGPPRPASVFSRPDPCLPEGAWPAGSHRGADAGISGSGIMAGSCAEGAPAEAGGRRPQFGSRLLRDPTRVFHHNAWYGPSPPTRSPPSAAPPWSAPRSPSPPAPGLAALRGAPCPRKRRSEARCSPCPQLEREAPKLPV